MKRATAQNAHLLPDDIRLTFDQLAVDRCGDDPHSFMITEDIIGHVSPGKTYCLETDQLTQWNCEPPNLNATYSDLNSAPPHVRVQGQWNAEETVTSDTSNILGGLGTLTLAASILAIPEAPSTSTALAFYGAHLLAVGDPVAFDADQNLPVTVVNIGSNYVSDYLLVDGMGCGAFIEYHDRPHLHMPLEETASGHILLGRADGDDYLLSGFRIPYGQAIYTPPYVLHADPYLVGRYLVVYSVTENYSTVVFRTADGKIVDAHINAT